MTAVVVCALLIPAEVRTDAEGIPLPAGAVARLGSARFRHPRDIIDHVRLTPDGRTVVTKVFEDLFVWDARTGRHLGRHPISVASGLGQWQAFELTADGREVVTIACEDEKYWAQGVDLATGRRVWRTPLAASGEPMAVAPGGRFAAACRKEAVTVYDTRTGRPTGTARFTVADVTAQTLALSADGETAAAAWEDRVEMVHVPTGVVRFAFATQPGRVFAGNVALSPDGGRMLNVVSVVGRCEPLLSETAAGTSPSLPSDFRYPPARMRFSPDGRRVAAAGYDPNGAHVYVWSVAGDILREYRVTEQWIGDMSFSADGNTLAAATGPGVVLWDIPSGRRLPHSSESSPVDTLGFAGRREVAVTGGELRVFDATNGREVRRLPGNVPDVRSVVLSPDGARVAVVTADRIEVRDAATGLSTHTFDPVAGAPANVWFAAGGRRLFTAPGGYGYRPDANPLRGWELADRAANPIRPTDRFAGDWTTSADGRTAACYQIQSDGGFITVRADVHVVALDAQRPRRSFRYVGYGAGNAPVLSADGRRLALPGMAPDDPTVPRNFGGWQGPGLPTTLSVWDTTTGRPLRGFVHDGGNGPMAFAPDGRSLAVAGYEGKLELWEVASGQLRHAWHHTGSVGGLAFSPDSALLAAASPDAPAFVWDVRGTLDHLPPRLDKAALEAHWRALAGPDAVAAFRAIRGLAAAPIDAVPFLAERLSPAVAPAAADADRWLAALDAPAFADREAAAAELKRVVGVFEPKLRQARDATASAEVRQRLDAILATIDAGSPESLRQARAVEAVAWMGTQASAALLRAWAGGAAGATLTAEATRAVGR